MSRIAIISLATTRKYQYIKCSLKSTASVQGIQSFLVPVYFRRAFICIIVLAFSFDTIQRKGIFMSIIVKLDFSDRINLTSKNCHVKNRVPNHPTLALFESRNVSDGSDPNQIESNFEAIGTDGSSDSDRFSFTSPKSNLNPR